MSLGGLAWLAGILILEMTFDSRRKTTCRSAFDPGSVCWHGCWLGLLERIADSRTQAKPSGP